MPHRTDRTAPAKGSLGAMVGAAMVPTLALACLAANLLVVPRFVYESTLQYWTFGPSTLGGIADASIHGGFLPFLAFGCMNLVVLLPTTLVLGARAVGWPYRSRAHARFERALAMTCAIVLGASVVPTSAWHRFTWLVAGPGPGGPIALNEAASTCDVDTYDALVRRGVLRRGDVRSALDGDGRAFGRVAIVHAARGGCLPIVRRLINARVDLDRPEGGHTTAWMAAKAGGHDDVATLLESHGASPRAEGVPPAP